MNNHSSDVLYQLPDTYFLSKPKMNLTVRICQPINNLFLIEYLNPVLSSQSQTQWVHWGADRLNQKCLESCVVHVAIFRELQHQWVTCSWRIVTMCCQNGALSSLYSIVQCSTVCAIFPARFSDLSMDSFERTLIPHTLEYLCSALLLKLSESNHCVRTAPSWWMNSWSILTRILVCI